MKEKMESKRPSLRLSEKYNGDDGKQEMFPELQTQLAHELSTMLDSQLVEMAEKRPSDILSSSGSEDLSFKLFTTSDINKCTKVIAMTHRRPLEESSSDSDSEYERLASVAVSAEQVLSASRLGHTNTKSEHDSSKSVKHTGELYEQHFSSCTAVDEFSKESAKKRQKQEGKISDVTPLNDNDTMRVKKHKKRKKHKCSELNTDEMCRDILNERTDCGKTFHVTPSDGTATCGKPDIVVKKKKHKKRTFIEAEK